MTAAAACACAAQDKINAFWEITKKDLEDRRAELRNQDRQMEETEDLHNRELKVTERCGSYCCAQQQQPAVAAAAEPAAAAARRACLQARMLPACPAYARCARCAQIYQQKVKHLLYEQQNNITMLKADGELALKLQQDEFYKREAELSRDKRALKQELKEQVGLQQLMSSSSAACVADSQQQQ